MSNTATAVGFVLTMANYCYMSTMLVMFMTCSKITKFRENKKKKIEDGYKQGNPSV